MKLITRPFDPMDQKNITLAIFTSVPPVQLDETEDMASTFALKLAICSQLYKGNNAPLLYDDLKYKGKARTRGNAVAVMQLTHDGVISVEEIELSVYQYTLSPGMMKLIASHSNK